MSIANTLYESFMGVRERIEAASKRAGFHSQSELAAACGVKQPSINALMSGKYPMRKLLGKVAELTKVDPRWLRFGDDDVRPSWALKEELSAVSAMISSAKPPKPVDVQTRDLLREILAEMQAQRALLEQLVGAAPNRQAAQKSQVYQIGDLARQKAPADAP